MIYIWTDESDTTGKYYANFYGGILIRSEHLEEVLTNVKAGRMVFITFEKRLTLHLHLEALVTDLADDNIF